MSTKSNGQLKLFTLDAFATRPFTGNPAAVCLLDFDTVLDDATLLNVAREINRTTAFLRPLSPQDDPKTSPRFGLRWFTVAKEIGLCGHATLATAAIIFYTLGNPNQAVTFSTLSGDLLVTRDGREMTMDFPVGLSDSKPLEECADLIKSLGKTPGVQEVRYCPSLSYLLVRLQDGWTRQEFEAWSPNIGQLQQSVTGILVTVVTTRGNSQQGYVNEEGTTFDFVSRCFAPWINIPEDPVTGSAQTILADYWSGQLAKMDFYTRQCSSRGGEMRLQLDGDRVKMTGKATVVMEATLRL